MAPQQGSGRDGPPGEGRLRWAMLALLFFCRTRLGFQFQTMGSAAPGVMAEIGLSLTEIGTLIGFSMLPGMVLSIPGGYAARHMSDKGLLVLGLLVMGLGGATAAIAAGFGMLALGRVLCGIGFVIGTIYLAEMVQDWFGGKELATAMGILVLSWPLRHCHRSGRA
ncbi:MAG: MFS transporter [Alphaproteobacteria bacterium]|nr:MFS transporter [Alphaproteobacteria bacterium]